MEYIAGQTRSSILIAIAWAVAIASVSLPIPACSNDSTPSDVVQLERKVGLRIAHVKDEGPVQSDKLKPFVEAQQDDITGEEALKARDFNKAMTYFQRADDLLDQIGM